MKPLGIRRSPTSSSTASSTTPIALNYPVRACENSVRHHPPLDRETIKGHSKQRPRGASTGQLQIGMNRRPQ